MRRPLGLDALGAALVILFIAALHQGLWLHPGSLEATGTFHPGHAWCFDHISRMLRGELPLVTWTNRLGFPAQVDARFIAWVPALISVPINTLFGSLVAYNIAFVLSCGLSVPAMSALARGRGAAPLASTLAGVAFALSPPLIGALANGQTCKAQLWFVPAVLAAADQVIRKGGLPAWVLLAVITVAGSFSEPTYALLLGLALPLWVLLTARSKVEWARAIVVVGLVAVLFGVIARYYDTDPTTSPFAPSVRLRESGEVNQSSQQASLYGLFYARPAMTPTGTTHVAYLGLPGLLLVLLSLRVKELRAPIFALTLLGVMLALGEFLVLDREPALVGGKLLALPDRLLAAVGYPLARSGQYYRAILLASVGVALALAGAPVSPRWRTLFLLVLVGDGLRQTSTLWPFPVRPVAGLAAWTAIREDPAPGAVLDLPLSVGNFNLGEALLAASLHGRPVQAIPVFMPLRNHDLFRKNLGWVHESLPTMAPDAARAALLRAGFGFVVWRPALREGGPTLAQLEGMFGPGHSDGAVRWWSLQAAP